MNFYNINMKRACPNDLVGRGFTLIEAILYLAIAGIILYFVSGFAFNAIFGRAKIDTIQSVNQSAESVLDEIGNTVGDSVEINGTN